MDHHAEMGAAGPLILGSTGRVGQALARVWDKAVPTGTGPGLWQHRPGRSAPRVPGFEWDILGAPPPDLPRGLSGIVVLAGGTGPSPEALDQNRKLALTACDLAERAGLGRVLVASSQAVYGPAPGLVGEDTAPAPANPYGAAKLAMEEALADRPGVTFLRIGNVAGTDMLSRNALEGRLKLDRFDDGQSPRRAYIGPASFARVLAGLLAAPGPLPKVLNISNPGTVSMEALLRAAGRPFDWVEAGPGALPELRLDTSALTEIVPLGPVSAEALVAEAREGGWPG